MPTDQLRLELLAERPVIRNDQASDVDIAIDLAASRSIDEKSSSYSLNLCVVIDRSGSMEGDKLEQAKRSCIDIYESLNPSDQLTVLAFDDEVLCVVNPQTPRTAVVERVKALMSGGSTDLSKGWYLGLLELQTYATPQHINRLVLLSDGMANKGEQKPSILGAESARARDQLGITTSTIGIGTGFQEDVLAALAHESGGRFWFIGEARIEDIIKEEFSGALSVYLERPRIEIDLPEGVVVSRELNDLPKTSNRYRIRPIKANDRFCFALRLRVDPENVGRDDLPITATLFDGAGVVTVTETVLTLGSIEEYSRSSEDPRVAMVVKRFLAATSDEQIAEKMDTGDVTTMLKMLQSQSDIMKELEAKLSGSAAISWEEVAEREKLGLERELDRLRMEIGENKALVVVGQLVDLMRGLGRDRDALALVSGARKMHVHRGMRNHNWSDRGDMDDWACIDLLQAALQATAGLVRDYPDLRDDLLDIRGKIDEHLAQFS